MEAADGINRTALREIKLLQELEHPNIIGVSIFILCSVNPQGFKILFNFALYFVLSFEHPTKLLWLECIHDECRCATEHLSCFLI